MERDGNPHEVVFLSYYLFGSLGFMEVRYVHADSAAVVVSRASGVKEQTGSGLLPPATLLP